MTMHFLPRKRLPAIKNHVLPNIRFQAWEQSSFVNVIFFIVNKLRQKKTLGTHFEVVCFWKVPRSAERCCNKNRCSFYGKRFQLRQSLWWPNRRRHNRWAIWNLTESGGGTLSEIIRFGQSRNTILQLQQPVVQLRADAEKLWDLRRRAVSGCEEAVTPRGAIGRGTLRHVKSEHLNKNPIHFAATASYFPTICIRIDEF